MIVYKTTNLVNGKFYIGQDSKNDSRYLGSGSLLKKAIKKYGRKNFIKEVIEVCSSLDQLNEREIYWIKELKAQEIGYNISDGGFRDSFVWSDEQRKIHSEFMKTQFDSYSDEWLYYQNRDRSGENSPNYKKTISEETRQKMSESHKKNPVRYWLGKTQSEESNKKRREKSLMFRHSEHHKQKITGEGNPFYGCSHSEKTKQKIRDSKKNRTPEQKLESYIKFYISRTGNYPSNEQIELKLQEYSNVNSL